jgi:hypothetical protein
MTTAILTVYTNRHLWFVDCACGSLTCSDRVPSEALQEVQVTVRKKYFLSASVPSLTCVFLLV